MRFISTKSVLFCAFLLMVTTGNLVHSANRPLTILAPFNLTGPDAVLDAPCYNGAKLAVEQLNAKGGVLGHSLELIPIDIASEEKTTAPKTAAALKKYPQAIAGIGFAYSTYALGAGKQFQAAHIPFISPGATAPDLPEKVGDYFFLAAYGDEAQAKVMATYALKQLGVKDVALWIDDSRVYTRTIGRFFDEFFQQMGGTVNKMTYAEDTTDFSPFIEAFTQADPQPEAIYAASMPRSAVTLIEQVRQAGIDVPLMSGDGWDDAEIIAASQTQDITGLYFTTHRFLGVDTPEMKQFVADYTKAFGTVPPNAFAPLGYDTINLLVSAIKRADSTDPDNIRQALASTSDFSGLVGSISYQTGKRVPEKAVAVIQVEEGQEKLIWTWLPKSVKTR
jgi:branched-chain amino acid transport system substrate-binding protein